MKDKELIKEKRIGFWKWTFTRWYFYLILFLIWLGIPFYMDREIINPLWILDSPSIQMDLIMAGLFTILIMTFLSERYRK